jgi:lysozyme family protein
MAVSYKIAIPSVKKWEGGLTYIQKEGQWTNRGIQFSTYSTLGKSLGLSKPISDANFKAMPLSDWEKFIKYFWDKATFNNTITNGQSALMMFQALWGSGGTGIKRMQLALNDAFGSSLSPDGGVGALTVGVINKHDKQAPAVLWNALSDYYNYLATNSPSKYGAFLDGWMNRLNDIKPIVIKTTIGLGTIALVGLGLFFLSKKTKSRKLAVIS